MDSNKRKYKHGKKYREEVNLYPALVNTVAGNLYGYIDKLGKFIINPRFTRADDFNNYGLAIVKENNLTGAINSNGEYIVKPVFDSISSYVENRAIYVENSKMGVLDEKGNKITKKTYNFISDYTDDRAVISIGDKDGNYRYGYIDKEGNEVIPAIFINAESFKDDLALVKLKDKEYALINKSGEIVKTYNYDYVGQYSDGMLVYVKTYGGLYGYINKDGEIITKDIYVTPGEFKDGIAIVSEASSYLGPYGAINKNGEYVYPQLYSDIKLLGEGQVALGMPLGDNNTLSASIYAIGNNSGKRLTDFDFLQVGKYNNGLAYVSNNLYTFFINKNGTLEKKLPIVKGSGQLLIKDDLVYADIDYSPYYLTKSGKIIYKPNTKINLENKYSVIKEKYKPNINYLIYYPVVKGVSNKAVEKEINIKLRKMSGFKPFTEGGQVTSQTVTPDDVLDYSYYGTFEIEFFKNQLFIPELAGYYYPIGAAHGMPYKSTPNIDLVTGKFYNLKDLFKRGDYWSEELNKIIRDMINNDSQYEYVFKDEFKGIKENQDFYVDENNLYIYFPPYEIAPYAAGFITFKIPFDDIDNMINKSGSFWKAFN